MAIRKHLVVTFLAACSALGFGQAHAAELLRSGSATGEQAYGRAGGLTGAERIAQQRPGTAPVTVVYDGEFVSRTNLPTDRAQNTRIGITWDAEYVGRTNMPRKDRTPVVAETGPERGTN